MTPRKLGPPTPPPAADITWKSGLSPLGGGMLIAPLQGRPPSPHASFRSGANAALAATMLTAGKPLAGKPLAGKPPARADGLSAPTAAQPAAVSAPGSPVSGAAPVEPDFDEPSFDL